MLNTESNDSQIILELEKLGKLDKKFKHQKKLIALLNHKSQDIRILSLKNLAKIQDSKYLNLFQNIALDKKYSLVRREAVSAIGRLNTTKSKSFLLSLLKDKDPNIVLQSLRALDRLKIHKEIKKDLTKLSNHKNEIIKKYVKEILSQENKDPKDIKKDNSFLRNIVVNADVTKVLDVLPDEVIDLSFTSPPYYNARDYSIYKSYKEYLEFLATVFKKLFRVTKNGRFFILNTSPVITPRISRSFSSIRHPIPFDIHSYLIDMGWVFIDDIVWVKPEASVRNRNGGFFQHRKPLGYKPNNITEYLMVYRKGNNQLIDKNMKDYDKETINKSLVKKEYESSNLWKIAPNSHKLHSATFPMELCDRVVDFYSYVGDLLFDPFSGSGTFAKSSINKDRYFFSTEVKKEYVDYFYKELLEKTSGSHNYKKMDFKKFKEYLLINGHPVNKKGN